MHAHRAVRFLRIFDGSLHATEVGDEVILFQEEL